MRRNNSLYIKWGLIVLSMLGSYVLYLRGVTKLPWNLDTALIAMFFVSIGCELKYNNIIDRVLNMQKGLLHLLLYYV